MADELLVGHYKTVILVSEPRSAVADKFTADSGGSRWRHSPLTFGVLALAVVLVPSTKSMPSGAYRLCSSLRVPIGNPTD